MDFTMYGLLLYRSNTRVVHSLRRTLFSFPGFPPLSSQEPQRYREQKLISYSQEQLYKVVSDVQSYPHFVPFCTASRITKPLTGTPGSGCAVMEAELTVGFHSFQESYTSKVTCVPFTSVQAEAASETPLFKELKTTWTFNPSKTCQTLVTLELVYAFANPLHAAVSAAFFGKVSKDMVRAFEERCHQVYRSPCDAIS